MQVSDSFPGGPPIFQHEDCKKPNFCHGENVGCVPCPCYQKKDAIDGKCPDWCMKIKPKRQKSGGKGKRGKGKGKRGKGKGKRGKGKGKRGKGKGKAKPRTDDDEINSLLEEL
jgi:hypothetical protein